MKTWQVEMSAVGSALAVSALLSGGRAVDWLAAVALLLSFGHASVSERLREREAARPVVEVHCHEWLWRYYVAKELSWVVYFIMSHAWPALVGCAVFLFYPAWRRLHRRHFPLGREVSP